ncbi:MAG: glycoside hydrolase [Rhodothermaceae bacterium]|nr:glycoside hydrolase [Rhodothermaceae bacterium]MBC14382.1 glycoside hydrolase [Rhodothermaceae bacterium]
MGALGTRPAPPFYLPLPPMRTLLSLLLLAVLAAPGRAQSDKYEFRGAWIATVANLDWPSCTSGCSSDVQKQDLIDILDGLQEVGVNAVVFQVRTESDALYDSPFEPWSYWLTGQQGQAPAPYYDPLAFATAEAHARGMELHAWINPYRADRGSDYVKDESHVTRAHPEWILSFSTGIKILDPGLPEVRDHVASIVGDIARRYDVDGVHYDDYFYPYPGTGFSGITDEDAATFAAHPRGFTDQGDWRRDNVNLLVAQIQDTLQAVRPEAVHGVSPFGIWKNNVPSGVRGLDAYEVIYADATAWLDAQTIDYLAPQLYWSSDAIINGSFNRQPFGALAQWWESVRNDRHVYPGLAAYRTGQAGFDTSEIPDQIRITRSREGIDGSIFFRANAGVLQSDRGLSDSLRTDLYATRALPPVMPWKSLDAPGAPTGLDAVPDPQGEPGATVLTWTAPADGAADTRFYAVYRVPEADAGDLDAALERAENLIGVTGETTFTDVRLDGSGLTYVVTAVSTNSVESAPSNTVVFESTDAETSGPTALLALDAPRPNPSAGPVTLSYRLGAPTAVTLRVVDVLGREVARLADDEPQSGRQTVTWQARTPGTYLVVLDAEGLRAVRPVVVVR